MVQSKLLFLKLVLWTDLNLTGGLYKQGVRISIEKRKEKSLSLGNTKPRERLSKVFFTFLKNCSAVSMARSFFFKETPVMWTMVGAGRDHAR